jgi:hypothetical protein
MTKREREQVVELLRCGASVSNIWEATRFIGASKRTMAHAYKAMAEAEQDVCISTEIGELYLTSCLEAASRVEEETWP